jgi:DNA invertase Pin-like site-specific DNA recombinase
MRIGIYARISTSNGRQDVDNQLFQLKEWAKRLSGVVVNEYVDEVSGTRDHRTALNQMLQDAHRREFDTLLIWALDRLGRGGIAQISGYMERLKSARIRVMSHQETWLDTNGPVADLLEAIFAWVAKQEHQRLSERVSAGLERARRQGKRLGRPSHSIDVQEALRLRQQGLSLRAIATRLGVSHSTVSRHLSQKPLQ